MQRLAPKWTHVFAVVALGIIHSTTVSAGCCKPAGIRQGVPHRIRTAGEAASQLDDQRIPETPASLKLRIPCAQLDGRTASPAGKPAKGQTSKRTTAMTPAAAAAGQQAASLW
jgi:hypothetical protein